MAIRVLHSLQTMASGGTASGVRRVMDSLGFSDFAHLVLVEKVDAAERAATPSAAALYGAPPLPRRQWWRRLWRIRQIIREQRVDVVHGRGWPGTDALVAGAGVPGVSLVFSGHGRPTQEPVPRSFSQRLVMKWLGRRLDAAFGVTPDLAAEVAADLGWSTEQVPVILNGVDLRVFVPADRQAPSPRSTPLRVGVAGRLVPIKRIDLVLRMVQSIVRTHGEQALLVEFAGDGPLRDSLARDASRYGIERNAIFRGSVRDMAGWYRAQDAIVLCSDYEGCSNTVLEAMASGVAVIATDVGVNRVLLGNGAAGRVIPCGDLACLIDAVTSLVDHRQLAVELGRQGRRLLEQGEIVREHHDAYARLYRQAVARRGKGANRRNGIGNESPAD